MELRQTGEVIEGQACVVEEGLETEAKPAEEGAMTKQGAAEKEARGELTG